MSLRSILIVLFSFIVGNILAQPEQHTIRLIDLDNSSPIVNATFNYGDQQGVSDKKGVIYFRYNAGNQMTLSHINYGAWTISDEELKNSIERNVYYRKSIAVPLYPVAIIGVRTNEQRPEEELEIEYQDRMNHDAANILNQIPAFNSIRKSGGYGFDPVFRGFKYDQLNVVLDGAQSATAACPNRMDPPTSQIAPNMMEHVEVLKGPYALRYGTGFGATINFIPSKLHFSAQDEFYGRLSSGYESNGNIVRGESQFGFSGSYYDVQLLGSWSQGKDYTTGKGNTVASGFERGSFGTNIGFKLSPKQQLRLSATYNRARDADFPALAMDLREDDTWLLNLKHEIWFDKPWLRKINTTFYGSFVEHLMDNLLKPLDPRMLNAETFATTFNYGGRSEMMWLTASGKLFAGADLRTEGAEGTRMRAFLMGPNAGKVFEDNAWQDSRIAKAALFAEYQVSGQTLDYVFSGRLEVNHSMIDDPGNGFLQEYSEPTTNQLNPSISLGIVHTLDRNTNIGLWFGRAQRSAGLTERFINYFPVGQDPYEMLGNPGLSPEVNHQIDLTFQWNTDKRTKLSFDLFASYLTDYISSSIDTTLSPRLPMSPGVRRYVNLDEAFKTGFEFSWLQQLIPGLQHHLGLAYTYAQDLHRNEPLPEIAPFDVRYILSGTLVEKKLKPEAVFRYASRQARISEEYGETMTPSFMLVNLKVGYAFSDKLSVKVGVNNLFDENYYEHLSRSVRGSASAIYAPGRSVFASLNLVF